jgi:hypothetical protein
LHGFPPEGDPGFISNNVPNQGARKLLSLLGFGFEASEANVRKRDSAIPKADKAHGFSIL